MKDIGVDFMDLTGQIEPNNAEWESDFHLLQTTAGLTETTPQALLHRICSKTDIIMSVGNLQDGKQLPIMLKAQLLRTLEERMQTEKEIVENACRDSQKLVSRVLPLFILLAVAAAFFV